MERGRIVLRPSQEYQEFINTLSSFKGASGKTLCLNCWSLLSNYQRDNIHDQKYKFHNLKLPKEWADEALFTKLAENYGKSSGNVLELPTVFSEKQSRSYLMNNLT